MIGFCCCKKEKIQNELSVVSLQEKEWKDLEKDLESFEAKELVLYLISDTFVGLDQQIKIPLAI